MPEIKITIKKDETTIDADKKFDTYQDAINYLDAIENDEMDKNHAHVMNEHK